MGEKNSKIILSVLIVLLLIVAVVLVLLVITKDKKQAVQTPQTNQQQIEISEESKDNGAVPLTEEKKEEIAAIKNTTGAITSVDIGVIVVSTSEGEDLTLKIPEEGANFVTQTVQEDGSFLIEEIGLFDIPENSEADIQYNSTSNEVMLVTVK